MSCSFLGGTTLVRPWPYEGNPPWPWRLVDFYNHNHARDKTAPSAGISSWIVFLLILFMVLWSGFR